MPNAKKKLDELHASILWAARYELRQTREYANRCRIAQGGYSHTWAAFTHRHAGAATAHCFSLRHFDAITALGIENEVHFLAFEYITRPYQ